MGILRRNVRSCVPTPERKLEREFMQSFTEEIETPVYNNKGQEVTKIKETVQKQLPVPIEVVRHDGLTVDMFSFAAQQDAGVALKPFVGDFMRPDLDELSRMGTSATSAVETMLSNKDNYVEPNKDKNVEPNKK